MNATSSLKSDNEHSPLLAEKNVVTQHQDKSGHMTNTSTSASLVTVSDRSKCLSRLERLKEIVPFLGVFAPLVVFWAIFYQQNSTWILQGAQMNCQLGKIQVPPGQLDRELYTLKIIS